MGEIARMGEIAEDGGDSGGWGRAEDGGDTGGWVEDGGERRMGEIVEDWWRMGELVEDGEDSRGW